jgi:membrane-bound lytic murein transglycosylase D
MSLKAGRKDSVASVAKRYRVSAAQVAQWNGVAKGASFAPGQTIVVFAAAGKASATKIAHANARKGGAHKHVTRTAAATPAKGAAKRTTVASSGRSRTAGN